MHGEAAAEARAAGAAQRVKTVDEVGGCRRQRKRREACEVRQRGCLLEIAAERRVSERNELALLRRGAAAVEPGARILGTRGGERGPADELPV